MINLTFYSNIVQNTAYEKHYRFRPVFFLCPQFFTSSDQSSGLTNPWCLLSSFVFQQTLLLLSVLSRFGSNPQLLSTVFRIAKQTPPKTGESTTFSYCVHFSMEL